MAPKNKGESSGRSNRFRMVVIDSDLSDEAIGNSYLSRRDFRVAGVL